MQRLLREPIVQFVLLGCIVFAAHAFLEARITRADRTIVVTGEELSRMAVILASEQGRVPSESELRGLLAAHIREEALYREAKRLGLQDDDTIIRRRLAQKMQFMIEDVARLEAPDDAALEDWFRVNSTRFETPEAISFSHAFFSPERRGETVEAQASAALSAMPNVDDWRSVGDPFMLQRAYVNLTREDTARLFGNSFAEAAFDIQSSEWTGPIGSALGVHLVRIDKSTPAIMPDFATVKNRVRVAWLDENRRMENENRITELIEGYTVQVETTSE